MLFKKLFSRSLSYGCILVSLTLPGHDQNDVVSLKYNWKFLEQDEIGLLIFSNIKQFNNVMFNAEVS